MNIIKKVTAAAMIGAAAIGLTGCATGLPTKVTRFQAMPAPQGQSFYVVPGMGEAAGSSSRATPRSLPSSCRPRATRPPPRRSRRP